jgi:hypothetical protein
MHLAARLYPRRWRKRYGAELHALIDDVSPGWLQLCDVMRGGMLMRIRTTNPAALAVALGVVGAGLAGIGALAAPARFESRGRITATAAGPTDPATVDEALHAVIERAAASAFGSGAVPRAQIAVTRTAASEIQVAYTDSDPRRAREMTGQLMTHAIMANLTLAEQAGANPSSLLRMKITTPPDLPQAPSRPYLLWLMVAGFGGGAMIGTAVGVVRRRARPRA